MNLQNCTDHHLIKDIFISNPTKEHLPYFACKQCANDLSSLQGSDSFTSVQIDELHDRLVVCLPNVEKEIQLIIKSF